MLGTARTYARLGARIGTAVSLIGALSLLIWIAGLGASTNSSGAALGALGILSLVIGFPVLIFSNCALREQGA